jgi:hypothetical protein
MKQISLLFVIPTIISCSTKTSVKSDFDYKKIEQLADSIQIENITVKNLFKYQILAHQSTVFDSTMIDRNVYKPHQKLWDSCYGVIFGDENGKKFNNSTGMIKWNRTLLSENKQDLIKRTKLLTDINLNKLIRKKLNKFSKLVPYQPKAKLSLLFTPITGIGFGGCNAEQFALELNNPGVDVEYTLTKGLPHEFNHLVYEKFRNADPDRESALSQTIDEGFACYFTYVFFGRKITQHEAVENMTQQQWDWYIKNEKEIFNKVKGFFADTSGDNPLLRNEKIKLFPEAPKTLNYWLGFRIITKYVEKYGKDSWKDLYTMTAKEVLWKSGYEDYIKKL